MNSELSVAVGVTHVTVVDVVPRSAFLRIFEGQFEKVGPETSLDLKKKSETRNQQIEKKILKREKRNNSDELPYIRFKIY